MYVLSLGMRFFGSDIVVSRGIAVVSNFICVLLIFYLSYRVLGKKEAFVTLILMAIAPWVVAYARFGLTYNLMALFFLLSLVAIYFYADQNSKFGWLFLQFQRELHFQLIF